MNEWNDCFDEGVMAQRLAPYIPQGESLLAGIHAVSQKSCYLAAFSGCICREETLLPVEHGETISLRKEKVGVCDVFLGMTANALLLVPCQNERFAYNMKAKLPQDPAKILPLQEAVALADLGCRIPWTDIAHCQLKKGLMGAMKCQLELKNGSSCQLLLPKRGGLAKGMPHYDQYRQALLARLGGFQN